MDGPRCTHWRQFLRDRAMGERDQPCDDGLRQHLQQCARCASYRDDLQRTMRQLDGVFPPVQPPPRVWRCIKQTVRPIRQHVAWRWLAALGLTATAALVWAGLAMASQADIHADETALTTSVWASHAPLAAYATTGISAGLWPSAMRGAEMVCRLHNGQRLVSVLLEDVPTSVTLRENISGEQHSLVRVLKPLGHQIMDVLTLPVSFPTVQSVQIWEQSAQGNALLIGWRVPPNASRRIPTSGAVPGSWGG